MPVVVIPPAEADAADSAHRVSLPDRTAFRAVPLLTIADGRDGSVVAVGQTRILSRDRVEPRVEVVVRALWHAGSRDGTLSHWRPIDCHDDLDALIANRIATAFRPPTGDAEADATRLAWRLAEQSRDHIASLRTCRYELERDLGDVLRGRRSEDLEAILASIVELSAMYGRAGDEAREAAREGLWTWRTDRAAYHAHRSLMDHTIVVDRADRRGHRRAWFRDLDSAVRHCRQVEALAGQEASLTLSLLNAASTIAVTRDARAQENFNLIATVGALLLGLPALVVALYSATAVLPITNGHLPTLTPVIGAGLIASAVAAFLPTTRRRRLLRFGAAVLATVVIVVTLAIAGTLVDPADGPDSHQSPSPSASPP